jgi:large subunit ribosomal protein L9
LAEKIALLPLVFKMKASESGKIFGSVTSQMIADAMAEKGVELEKKTITVEPFKTVGTYTAEVRLHKHVKGTINFTVEAEGALVKDELDAQAAAKKELKAKKAAEAEAAAAAEVAAQEEAAATEAPAEAAPAIEETPAE